MGEVTVLPLLTARKWALNSAVECHLHTVEVIGSNPIAPTTFEVPRLRSGFRLRAQTPAKRLKFESFRQADFPVLISLGGQTIGAAPFIGERIDFLER